MSTSIFLFMLLLSLISQGDAKNNDRRSGNYKPPYIGGEQKANPADRKFYLLAKRLLQENTAIDEGEVRSITIEAVTTQVVAGEVIRMKYNLALTDGTTLHCYSKTWLKPYYHIDTGKNIEIEENNCYARGFGPNSNSRSHEGENYKPTHLRTESGGEQKADPSDPKFYKLAKRLLYENKDIDEGNVKSITIKEVTTQVVAGEMIRMNYNILLDTGVDLGCYSEAWLKPYNDIDTGKNIEIRENNCYAGGFRPKSNTRSQKGENYKPTHLRTKPGGQQKADPGDPRFYKLAKRLLYENKDIDEGNVKSITIKEVTTQVVAGEMIRMNYNILLGTGVDLGCYSEAWLKPYNDIDTGKNIEIRKNDCYAGGFPPKSNTRSQKGENYKPTHLRTKPGGQQKADPSDPRFYKLAKRLLYENKDIDEGNVKSITIKEVTTQVVAGEMIRMNYNILLGTGVDLGCYSEAWLKPYNDIDTGKNIEIRENNCYAGGLRPKSNIRSHRGFGSEKEADPGNPRFYKLAKRLLYKNKDIDEENVNSITIKEVTTQVVAGEVIRMRYNVVLGTGVNLKCYSEAWLKPHYNIDMGKNIEIGMNNCYAGGFIPYKSQKQKNRSHNHRSKLSKLFGGGPRPYYNT